MRSLRANGPQLRGLWENYAFAAQEPQPAAGTEGRFQRRDANSKDIPIPATVRSWSTLRNNVLVQRVQEKLNADGARLGC